MAPLSDSKSTSLIGHIGKIRFYQGLNSRYDTAARKEHPASCHIASSSQKCYKLGMPSLFKVEGVKPGKARQWPEVAVPLSTMIRVQAPLTAPHLTLEAGDWRGREDGRLGKVE